MMIQNGIGIVLKRTRHLEADTRLTLFLKDQGKVIATLKGGQKMGSKLRAVAEPFTEADFHLFLPPHGTFARLIGGRLIDSHQHLRASYPAFETASRCCEVVDALLPYRAPSADVYDILRISLQNLQNTTEPRIEWMVFLLNMLKKLGHGDHSMNILKLAGSAPSVSPFTSMLGIRAKALPSGPESLSDASLNRCLTFLEDRLSLILPAKLKAERIPALHV